MGYVAHETALVLGADDLTADIVGLTTGTAATIITGGLMNKYNPVTPVNPSGSSVLTNYGDKSDSYLSKRGWTWDSAQDVVKNRYTTSAATNKVTGNPATAYFNKAGDYIVVDNVTGGLVQASQFGNALWIPDATIINPYKP